MLRAIVQIEMAEEFNLPKHLVEMTPERLQTVLKTSVFLIAVGFALFKFSPR